MAIKATVCGLLIALTLTACAADDPNRKEKGGALIGAGAGALLGSRFGDGGGRVLATGLGAMFGAFVGSEVGQSLDKADQTYARQTAHDSLENSPSGKQTVWSNPDTGNSGTITPVRTYQQDDGDYCREFHQTVTIGGKEENAYGTACRQPDGSWKMTEQAKAN